MMPPHVFFMPDGSRQVIHAFAADVADLHAQLGAIASGALAEAERIEATLYGRRACEVCSVQVEVEIDVFLGHIDRPANRLPWGRL